MRRYKELSIIKIREERIFCILLELFEVFEYLINNFDDSKCAIVLLNAKEKFEKSDVNRLQFENA